MKKVIPLALMLSGCATIYHPVQPDYSGPISIIESSEKIHNSTKADLFYLYKINEKNIINTMNATRGASQGQGFFLTTELIKTSVPSEKATFTIKGRTTFAAPIQSLASTVYEVTGDVTFSPEPNATYIVKGSLDENYSAVWIESKETGQVINKKIEINGSAALGLFEK